MKSILVLLLAFLFSTVTTTAQNYAGVVTKVKDGDTFVCYCYNVDTKELPETLTVRLYGIDAVELRQHAMGRVAKDSLSNLILNKKVFVGGSKMDLYGRLIGVVSVELNPYLGLNVNEYMIANGLAFWYQDYAKKDVILEKLQKQAQEKKIGIWAFQDIKVPSMYRKAKKNKAK